MDIASISAVVAAGGVIVGVVFTVLELRNLIKQRQTDLVIRLYSTMGSSSLQEVWEKTEIDNMRASRAMRQNMV